MAGKILAAALVAFVLALAGVGCSAILGDASYQCTTGADACPSGMVCNTTSLQCEVAVACQTKDDCPSGETCSTRTGTCSGEIPDATADSPFGDDDDDDDDDDATPGREAGVDAGKDGAADSSTPPADSGIIACVNGACSTGLFCATSAELGGAFPTQCTRTCCTSSDCAANFLCVPVGTTGSYCLPDTVGSEGTAPETCCNDTSCSASGGVCHFGSGGATGTSSFGCSAAGGTGVQETSCTGASTCRDGYCGRGFPAGSTTASFCRQRCCTSTQCGTTDAGYYCHDESSLAATGGTTDGQDYVSVCYEKHETPQFLALNNNGSPCGGDGDCKSGLCDLNATTGGVNRCMETCCVDTDCASGQSCLPRTTGVPFLRCIPTP